ncbi:MULTISPECIES: YcgN family cysteine cluster protein [unclassified Acinetobacter]|uniref:YcgN family cysteine cluster protein n=1 Tax=unclassified Acinetobacter TaxID=196816 RepID=UPI0035BB0321
MSSLDPQLRPNFWKNYSLEQLTQAEWEALCDGCGQCCLVKLEDEDTGDIAYTKVACKLLDCQTARCQNYAERKNFVPDCVQLDLETLKKIKWLPSSCAYRRLLLNKDLPPWHYLITGDRQSVIKAKKSIAKRCIPESSIDEDDIENYIVRWVR